jgi:steroid delta-isomerase-like uncharacterized protein
MSVEQNVRLMRRWFQEVWNDGKMQTIYELLAEDVTATGELEDGGALHGPAEFEQFSKRIRGAFPDMRVVVEDVFGADDKMVVRWSAAMTHSGHDLGIPATGKPVTMTGMTMVRIRNGKVVQGWDNWDQAGMRRQLAL